MMPAGSGLVRRAMICSDIVVPTIPVPKLAGPDAVAAGLCPPPAVFSGQEATAGVCRPGEAGQTAYRQARFIPLGASADEVIGVVALLGSEDFPEPTADSPPASVESEPVQLRELLQRFRRQAVLRHGIDRLVGISPAIRRARAQVELAAGEPVLACCWWARRAAVANILPTPSTTGPTPMRPAG